MALVAPLIRLEYVVVLGWRGEAQIAEERSDEAWLRLWLSSFWRSRVAALARLRDEPARDGGDPEGDQEDPEHIPGGDQEKSNQAEHSGGGA
jgi:hypothetical protein